MKDDEIKRKISIVGLIIAAILAIIGFITQAVIGEIVKDIYPAVKNKIVGIFEKQEVNINIGDETCLTDDGKEITITYGKN